MIFFNTVIIIPLLTRWVSQEEYGIFDLMITYVSLLIPFITFNCGEAAFRFLLDDATYYTKMDIHENLVRRDIKPSVERISI